MPKIRFRFRVKNERAPIGIILGLIVLISSLTLFSMTRARGSSSQVSTQISASANPGIRQFYLTRSLYNSFEAPTACISGYHFASIWELADPSSLKYNKALGWFSGDSGEGPPTVISFLGNPWTMRGWVRTGYNTSTSEPAGHANCSSWLSNYEFYWGTIANLPSNWTNGEQDIGVWNVNVRTCNENHFVWCVQDDSVWRAYLPIILR